MKMQAEKQTNKVLRRRLQEALREGEINQGRIQKGTAREGRFGAKSQLFGISERSRKSKKSKQSRLGQKIAHNNHHSHHPVAEVWPQRKQME